MRRHVRMKGRNMVSDKTDINETRGTKWDEYDKKIESKK